jgi:hypothetical protein
MNTNVYNKNTIEYITVVKEFVYLCEKENLENALETALILQKLFPLIYLKALLLPDFENSEEDLSEIVDEYLYDSIKHKFENLFGELDLDCKINTKEESEEYEPLSEIIADIYQDSKNLIVNYQSGIETLMETALYINKQNFEIYWGQRLLSACSALHNLVFFDRDSFNNIKTKKFKALDDVDTSDWIFTKVQKSFDR